MIFNFILEGFILELLVIRQELSSLHLEYVVQQGVIESALMEDKDLHVLGEFSRVLDHWDKWSCKVLFLQLVNPFHGWDNSCESFDECCECIQTPSIRNYEVDLSVLEDIR